MSEYTREPTEEEIEADRKAMAKEMEQLRMENESLRIKADRMVKMAEEMEHLRMENESLREVIAWLNIKMLNQEKDRRW